MMNARKIAAVVAVGALALISPTCGGSPTAPSAPPAPDCNPALWDHVYHPSRLKVVNTCLTATGVTLRTRPEPDGDYHIELKLDAADAGLLNGGNVALQDGALVLEPICQLQVTQADAVQACQGFTERVGIPPVGSRISVTGSYVLDTQHGWMEIHPVSRIRLVP